MTRKHAYLLSLSAQPYDWVKRSAEQPTKYMTRTHIALHLIELRRRDRITSYYNGVDADEGWT